MPRSGAVAASTPSQPTLGDPWVARLRGDGAQRQEALAALQALLVRAARFEIGRRRGLLPGLGQAELDELAQQCADDAVVAVLGKLSSFRGESRFTTWAYKFALYEAAVKVRRLAWRGREIPLDPADWPRLEDGRASTERQVEQRETLAVLRASIEADLTPHQREVLVAIALDGVPIDVLAERLQSTRGALYKTLHDARRKLRGALAAKGMRIEEEAHG